MIRIISPGKIKEKYLKDAIDEYTKRISRFQKIEIVEVKDYPLKDNMSLIDEENVKTLEGKEILSKISDDYVIALSLKGEMIDSIELSKKIESIFNMSKSKITFVIGGSLGLSKEVLDRSDYKLSFSKMTFPHQLFRVILLEQIYRSFKIINHEVYHK